jgi:hypothetical protein
MAFSVIRNPSVFADRDNTKVLHDEESWQYYAAADGCKAGDVNLQQYRNFFPYITQTEIAGTNPLGVIPFDQALSPYDANLNWIDSEFQPNFRGEYNYNCEAGNSWVENYPSPSGVMLSWGQDWYNNQFGVYKSNIDGLTIHEKREKAGQLWVRNPNKSQVGQSEAIIAGVIDNYSSHPVLSSYDFDQGVVDIQVYNDILFVRTPQYALVEKIRLNRDNEIFSLTDDSGVLSYEGSFAKPYFINDSLYMTSFSADTLSLYQYRDGLQLLASTSSVSAVSDCLTWDISRNTWVNTRMNSNGDLNRTEFRSCVGDYNIELENVTALSGDYRLLDFDYIAGDAFYVLEEQTTPAVFIAAEQGFSEVVELSGLGVCSESENVASTEIRTNREFRPLALHYHHAERFEEILTSNPPLVGISALEGAYDANINHHAINVLTKPLSGSLNGGENPFIRQGGTDRGATLQYLITASLSSVSSVIENQWSIPYHPIPLKTLQNNDYQYTCVDSMRTYHTLNFGVKGVPYDRPVLGYSSSYASQTFESDVQTRFVFPHNALPIPLSASTLACDGAIAGSCPSNSDLIYHHIEGYTPNTDFLVSWLSGDGCNVQWVDRYIANAGVSGGSLGDFDSGFDSGFDITTIIYGNAVTDVNPSQMSLVPGDEYTYLRRGRNLNNAYIQSLSSTLVFSIDGVSNDIALDSSGGGFDSPITK